MNDWVVEVKDFEEERLEDLYTLLNKNGINKVKDLINLKNKKIDQLTNDWNKLEEWLKSIIECETLHKGNYMTVRGEWGQEVLGKMKEIKEGNNVQNNDKD